MLNNFKGFFNIKVGRNVISMAAKHRSATYGEKPYSQYDAPSSGHSKNKQHMADVRPVTNNSIKVRLWVLASGT